MSGFLLKNCGAEQKMDDFSWKNCGAGQKMDGFLLKNCGAEQKMAGFLFKSFGGVKIKFEIESIGEEVQSPGLPVWFKDKERVV